jgi:O-antigen ligase
MMQSKTISPLVALLLFLLPVALLSELSHGSAIFFGLVVLCIVSIFVIPQGVATTRQTLRNYRGLGLALFFSVAVATLASIYAGRVLESEFERTLRIFIGSLAILAACLSLNPQVLRQASWGLTLGAWVAAYYAISLSGASLERPDNLPNYNATSYSGLALLITTLSTLSLGWPLTHFRRTEIAIKLLTIVAGLFALLLLQTRGSWVALPFFILIGIVLFQHRNNWRKIFLLSLLGFVIIAAVFASRPVMRERFHSAVHEFSQCFEHSKTDSSVCIRFQLWRASWLMFKSNPILGNSSNDEFQTKLAEYAALGIISEFTAKDFGEPHNDIVQKMASYGVLGLIGLLMLYLVPGWIFLKRLSWNAPQATRVAAAMGLSVCVGFMCFGLTELMFRGMRTIGFYAAMIGWLLALSDTNYSAKTDTVFTTQDERRTST